MSEGRHSYVPFYPSDWVAGTARMTPMQELVYFRVCCFTWDKAMACPMAELPLMLGGVEGWHQIVDDLVTAGKLDRTPDGSVVNTRALIEAEKARDLWAKKSKGGKRGAARTNAKSESGDDSPAKSGDGSDASTRGRTDAGSDVETRPGVAAQNQNQNQKEGGCSNGTDARDDDPPSGIPLDDWSPSDATLAHAAEHAPGIDVAEQARMFRDFNRAKGATAMADPDAAFRVWLDRERKHRAKGDASLDIPAYLKRGDPATMDDAAWCRLLDTYRKLDVWNPRYGPKPGQVGCMVPAKLLAEAAQ